MLCYSTKVPKVSDGRRETQVVGKLDLAEFTLYSQLTRLELLLRGPQKEIVLSADFEGTTC